VGAKRQFYGCWIKDGKCTDYCIARSDDGFCLFLEALMNINIQLKGLAELIEEIWGRV